MPPPNQAIWTMESRSEAEEDCKILRIHKLQTGKKRYFANTKIQIGSVAYVIFTWDELQCGRKTFFNHHKSDAK
jgi:hypothetical protein